MQLVGWWGEYGIWWAAGGQVVAVASNSGQHSLCSPEFGMHACLRGERLLTL